MLTYFRQNHRIINITAVPQNITALPYLCCNQGFVGLKRTLYVDSVFPLNILSLHLILPNVTKRKKEKKKFPTLGGFVFPAISPLNS